MKTTSWAAVAVVAMGMAAPVMAQTVAPTVAPTAAKRLIVVSLEDRKLALVEDGQVKKVYTVAIGKPSTPSPVGTFTIERRVANPVYHHGDKTVQPGPGNPVGTRWMGLSIKGYGIHGTNVPSSIGKAASHGCIRMGKADVEELFDMVEAGDTVELKGERDEEVVKLFGPVTPAAPAAQPEVAAKATTPATAAAPTTQASANAEPSNSTTTSEPAKAIAATSGTK
jgi:hypothetical protein